ncbi:MAG: ATP-binding protein [Candidatus Margulisiibacteriota bacterium]
MLSLESKGLEKDLLEKMHQLIKIIWAAVPVAILVLISTGVNQTYPSLIAFQRPIYFIIASSLFLTGTFLFLTRTQKYLELQVFFTHLSFVFICIVGIHYSGGIESPLYVIILIFFLFASVVIPTNMSIALSTVTAILYVLLITTEHFEIISHINFLHSPLGQPIRIRGYDQVFLVVVRVSLFYLVAIVPGYLAAILREKNIKLELANAQLQETQIQMVQTEKLASVGRLISGITHEIKNPLTSILGFSELSCMRMANKEKELNLEELKDFMDKVVHSTKHCIDVVQNLLDFARSAEDNESQYKPVNINHSIEEVLKIIEHQVYLQNIKIIRNFSADVIKVNGNDSQLRQVFLNMIVNAKDAMLGGGKLTIMTFLKPDDHNFAEIKFIDTGYGIIQEKLDKIFEPFFTTKPKGEGTGLGLSVSYGIIQNHKGSIDVQSAENKGTVFTISLPIYTGKEPAAIESSALKS